MSYYLAAWVSNGVITTVETDMMPIVENHIPDQKYDLRIIAEVAGCYTSAENVHPLLTLHGNKLSGLDFINQHQDWPEAP